MAWRLFVVDGGNQGQFFLLPEEGSVTIGRSQRHAEIILNDIYVTRVHCSIRVDGAGVLVQASPESTAGTFVNGQKITEHLLLPGEVLRVGNSHLRLEPHDPDAPLPERDEAETSEPRKLPTLPPERLADLTGHTLAQYEVGEMIGQGHYGVVFLALNQKTGQTVALKVLSPEFPANSDEMQTFVGAIRTLLPLRHPNLVMLTNAGKTGPYCWLAIEHVEGESVAESLRERDARTRSHWKAGLRIAIHLGRALAFLRQHRLVHGNISPANVLFGRNKLVKLGDLMLNRALEGSALQQARLEEKLLAELAYLAPEQITPDTPVDALTDLYGTGAVVYARLTGRPPFEAKTPEATLELIADSMPRKPIEIHKSIPEELSAAVMRLLARRPEDRYQTPEELLADLEPVAVREEVEV